MPESAGGLRRLNAFARALLALAAVSLALTIAACSSNSTQNKSASTQVSSQQRLIERAPIQDQSSSYRAASARQRPQQSHRANRTLLARQPAPDCEFKGPEPDTVDADQWARLKLDYERHCYQQAEMLARKRLDQLLASGKCRAESD